MPVIVDLDELVLRCREGDSRALLVEAIGCYRIGAFRACIVSTWLAVVYDIMGKLRELAAAGDKLAHGRVDELDTIVRDHQLDKALAFERTILSTARDEFELISQTEFIDLHRIFEDRHRCAHPSLNRPGEVYRPTAEVARAHIRVAVEHLLANPPAQGKSALERVLGEINSELFPTDPDEAATFLKHGPMARPRDVLTRNVVNALISSLLSTMDGWRPRLAALLALRQMHRSVVEPHLGRRLSDKAASVDDGKQYLLIFFLRSVSDSWQYLSPVARMKLDAYVRKLDVGASRTVMGAATDVPELADAVKARLDALDEDALTRLVQAKPSAYLVRRSIELYAASSSFTVANRIKKELLVPLLDLLTTADALLIVEAASVNGSIQQSFSFANLVRDLRRVATVDVKRLDSALKAHEALEHLVPSEPSKDAE